jgi:hypothetical protein
MTRPGGGNSCARLFLRIVGRVPARDFKSGRQGHDKRGYRRFRPVASRNRRQRLGGVAEMVLGDI